jgi:hypothetical protein
MTPATLPDVRYVSLSDNISLTDLAVEYIVYISSTWKLLPIDFHVFTTLDK